MDNTRGHYQLKLALIGSDGVGKTSIRRRYLGLGFKTSHIKTLGSDFSVKTFEFDNIYAGKAIIWDLAGEAFRIPKAEIYLKGAVGILAIYDVTNRKSLETLPTWAEWASQEVRDTPFYIIGNKIDLEENREVQSEDVDTIIDQIDMNESVHFHPIKKYETSARTGEGINSAFEDMLRTVIERLLKEETNQLQ